MPPWALAAGVDPLAQAERAQSLFANGPLTAVAGIMTVAAFSLLTVLLSERGRAASRLAQVQDKHLSETLQREDAHAKALKASHDEQLKSLVQLTHAMRAVGELKDEVKAKLLEVEAEKQAAKAATRRLKTAYPQPTAPKREEG